MPFRNIMYSNGYRLAPASPLQGFTGWVDGTNIRLNGDGTFVRFDRGGDVTGNIAELGDLTGKTFLDDKGNRFNLQNMGPSGWQTGLSYGLAGLEALSGLMNAFTGYKNYKLAKDQFGFTKAAFNRNLANQAKIINNTYDNAAQVAAGMIGGTDSYGNYGMVNQDIVDRYAAEAEKKHVDGSKI
jgi:hypothetical protein